MDERGAARYLGVSADVLRLWRSRSNDQGPSFSAVQGKNSSATARSILPGPLDRGASDSRQPVQNPETAAVHGGGRCVMTPAQNRADPRQVETLSKGRITQA